MSGLFKKLGTLAKSLAFLAWGMGVLFLILPIMNNRPIDWSTLPGMALVGVFWWGVGWWFERKSDER